MLEILYLIFPYIRQILRKMNYYILQCSNVTYGPKLVLDLQFFLKIRQKKKRGSRPTLLAGAYTDIWLEREDLGTSLLRCPGKIFRQETKMLFPCYGTLLINLYLEFSTNIILLYFM
jgi:hypothetical protein